MEPGFNVAIITSATSVVVALISLLAALVINRRSIASLRWIEAYKHSLSESQNLRKIQDEQLSETVASIRESMRAIQYVKDELLLVISSTPETLYTDEAVNRLVIARDTLFKTYQKHHPNLSSTHHWQHRLPKLPAVYPDPDPCRWQEHRLLH